MRKTNRASRVQLFDVFVALASALCLGSLTVAISRLPLPSQQRSAW